MGKRLRRPRPTILTTMGLVAWLAFVFTAWRSHRIEKLRQLVGQRTLLASDRERMIGRLEWERKVVKLGYVSSASLNREQMVLKEIELQIKVLDKQME